MCTNPAYRRIRTADLIIARVSVINSREFLYARRGKSWHASSRGPIGLIGQFVIERNGIRDDETRGERANEQTDDG